MQSILKEKLQAYIIENNPEIIAGLLGKLTVNEYLENKVRSVMPYVLHLLGEEKPGPVIAELALEKMTEELRPSRFKYIKEILSTEFREDYEKYKAAGVLTSVGINMLKHCAEVFDVFNFKEENADSSLLRHAIIAKVHDYLN